MTQPAAGKAARELDRAPRGTPVGPCLMVIYGASGDLTRRKLVPALYNLAVDGFLPEEFAVVGMARSPLSDEEFRARLDDDLRHLGQEGERPLDADVWQRLRGRLHYHAGDFSDPEAFASLGRTLERVDREHRTGGNLLHYLAVAPSMFCPVVSHLGAAGLVRQEGPRWRRVIVEKPFGHDLESARALNRALRQVLDEEQIYRIDHYLGKETVQNILVLRFGNGLFEPVWNRRYIDHVQMTVAETVGVEGRGGYYDQAGALRDMVPNHMMQVLSLVAMEPPTSFEAEAVREEKAKLLRAIKLFSEEDVLTQTVRGQYGAAPGRADAPGYRQEEKVDSRSSTETYAALKLSIDNWRWAGVPVYVRTGKRLARRVSEIAIFFRRPPFLLFRDTPIHHLAPNQLIIRIQPEEGIAFHFNAKVPGQKLELGDVAMDFRYDGYFGARPSTGYETLLHDAMRGDGTLFQRADMVEAGWSLVEPVLDVWRALPARSFPNYPAHTWGPREADELLARDQRSWRVP